MEQNLEKRSENTLTKSNIASYVHDMKELEKEQFTLEQLNKKCIDELNRTEENNNRKIKLAESVCQEATKELNEALQNRKTPPQEIIDKPPEKIFRRISRPLSIVLAVVIVYVSAFVIGSLSISNHIIIAILIFGMFFLLTIPFIIHDKTIRKREFEYLEKKQQYDQYINSLSQYNQQEKIIENCQNQYALTQKNLEEAKKHCAETQKQIEKLYHISKYLSLHISKIQAQKTALYSLNIVPPDYRKLDCLIEFDQMFRNDLVDTMREAVKIYEERVFRGELVRGIDNIYNMLGNLSASMHNIENTLYGIQSEVRLMSDEIYNISAATESFQSNMLSESRAARYATEALQKSQEKCESYLRSQYYNI